MKHAIIYALFLLLMIGCSLPPAETMDCNPKPLNASDFDLTGYKKFSTPGMDWVISCPWRKGDRTYWTPFPPPAGNNYSFVFACKPAGYIDFSTVIYDFGSLPSLPGGTLGKITRSSAQEDCEMNGGIFYSHPEWRDDVKWLCQYTGSVPPRETWASVRYRSAKDKALDEFAGLLVKKKKR